MRLFNLSNLAILLVFVAWLTGCKHEEPQHRENTISLEAVPVSVAEVLAVLAAAQTEVVGTVQAVERAEISSKITGNITALTVDLGSVVQQGALLVELSAGEISAQVQQARAQYDQANRNLQREENLLKKQAATEESVKSFRDQKKIAEGSYNEALTMLEYTKITAPFSGIVTRKFANIGDLSTPGKPLLHLEKQGRLEIQTSIPEAMILKINKGDVLSVDVPSAELKLKATVAEVSPTADPSSRTAPIKLQIEPHPKLRSGQFARVSLITGSSMTLVVPRAAIVEFGQMEQVFVVEDNKARLRLIRTGQVQGESVEVLSGLQEGEDIIVAGHTRLIDGQPVTIQ